MSCFRKLFEQNPKLEFQQVEIILQKQHKKNFKRLKKTTPSIFSW